MQVMYTRNIKSSKHPPITPSNPKPLSDTWGWGKNTPWLTGLNVIWKESKFSWSVLWYSFMSMSPLGELIRVRFAVIRVVAVAIACFIKLNIQLSGWSNDFLRLTAASLTANISLELVFCTQLLLFGLQTVAEGGLKVKQKNYNPTQSILHRSI